MENTKYRAGFLNAFWWSAKPENTDDVKRVLSRYPFISSIEHPAKIYHYTSAEALIGIVRDHGFFMTHCSYLNDSAEISHGREIAQQVLIKLSSKSRYQAIRVILQKSAELVASPSAKEYYVSCFTKEQDSLEQWRAYCPNGGINIEMSAPYGGNLGVGPRLLFQHAMYDETDKIRLIIFLVRKYIKEFIKDIEYYGGIPPYEMDEEYAAYLASEISHLVPTFKHPAFRSENEIRIVAQSEQKQLTVHSRPSGQIIIPFLKTNEYIFNSDSPIPPSSEPPLLNISKIIIGPQPKRELVAESIRTFMQRNGYPEIEVMHSVVPYRN